MPNGGVFSSGSGLRLQAVTPGVTDLGNANISGTMLAGRYRSPYPTVAAPSTFFAGSIALSGGRPVTDATGSVLIGENIRMGSLGGCVLIGEQAVSGEGLTYAASNAVIIGNGAAYTGVDYGGAVGGVAIGLQANIGIGNHGPIAIGNGAQSSVPNNIEQGGIAIGKLARVQQQYNVAIGSGTQDGNFANVVIIGSQGQIAPQAESVVIGWTQTYIRLGRYIMPQGFTQPRMVGTANATLANSVAETSLLASGTGNRTIAANTLAIGTAIKIHIRGTIRNTGTPTLQLKMKLDSGTICDTGAITMPAIAAASPFELDAEFAIRTIGAGGTCIGNLLLKVGNTTWNMGSVQTATTAINTTAARTVDVTATWGTANAANEIITVNDDWQMVS